MVDNPFITAGYFDIFILPLAKGGKGMTNTKADTATNTKADNTKSCI